ncbi:prepilin-type N-terminal cleavage/methylation domain-containing protein [Candidatus Mycosynbacter amalyticus]|nr:prepilin-type N-terminal cleavage/methylation domain-containing protein [Candidatus Mycosynbacter amalyticus]
MYKTNRGFTIPELLVAMTIAAILLVGLVSLVINLVNTNAATIELSKQVNEVQSGIGSFRTDIGLSQRFLMTTTITDTTPAGNSWDFRGGGNTNRVLILNVQAASSNPLDTSRQPTYLQAGGCPIGTSPAYNNIVYFVSSGTLYRRMIVQPPSANLYCSGQSNAQTRTCSNPGSGGSPSNCQEKDVAIIQNVTNFNVEYYNQAGDTTPNQTLYNTGTAQSLLDGIATLRISLSTQKNIDGVNTNEYATSIRVTRPIAF